MTPEAVEALRARFAACVAVTLRWEGGYVDHPEDPGGCTNHGITRATLERWRRAPTSCEDVRALTVAEARQIYRGHYWNAIGADWLWPGLDLGVFDFAVNSGRRRAAQFLQRQLGVEDDGVIGPVTLAAAAAVQTRSAFLVAYCDARDTFLRALDTWDTFGLGWTRRIVDIRTAALRMAGPG